MLDGAFQVRRRRQRLQSAPEKSEQRDAKDEDEAARRYETSGALMKSALAAFSTHLLTRNPKCGVARQGESVRLRLSERGA